MKTTYKTFATVRLAAAYSGPSAYGGGVIYNLPAGKVGTIVDLLSGDAFEVEFTVSEPKYAPSGEVLDYGQGCIVTLRPDQVAPANRPAPL